MRATIPGARASRRLSGTPCAPRSARRVRRASPRREAHPAAVVPRVLRRREHGARRVSLSEGLESDEQATACGGGRRRGLRRPRSEEHTSELQSPCNLVCRLLLEKKKNI